MRHIFALKHANISELEKQIDEMVYQLYELTKEEIAIIENSNNKTTHKNG